MNEATHAPTYTRHVSAMSNTSRGPRWISGSSEIALPTLIALSPGGQQESDQPNQHARVHGVHPCARLEGQQPTQCEHAAKERRDQRRDARIFRAGTEIAMQPQEDENCGKQQRDDWHRSDSGSAGTCGPLCMARLSIKLAAFEAGVETVMTLGETVRSCVDKPCASD